MKCIFCKNKMKNYQLSSLGCAEADHSTRIFRSNTETIKQRSYAIRFLHNNDIIKISSSYFIDEFKIHISDDLILTQSHVPYNELDLEYYKRIISMKAFL